jgi:hypothetical protein
VDLEKRQRCHVLLNADRQAEFARSPSEN